MDGANKWSGVKWTIGNTAKDDGDVQKKSDFVLRRTDQKPCGWYRWRKNVGLKKNTAYCNLFEEVTAIAKKICVQPPSSEKN